MAERSPRVGVGAIVVRDDAILLVQRDRPPYAGEWAIPGGGVQWGETLAVAAEREILEETGVVIRAGEVLYTFELLERDAQGEPLYHYVVLDVAGEYLGGEPDAGDDARAAGWVPFEALDTLPVNATTLHCLQALFPGRFRPER